jgi:predicted nucleic acid-binding protein
VILIDTSVLIDYLKGTANEGVSKFERILSRSIPFGISSFIYQEILQGAASLKEYDLLKRYLETQRFYHPKDQIESYEKAAFIYMQCRRRGITIRSTIDCLIAQIAMEHELTLLHNDSDFDLMAKIVPLKLYS